MADPEILAEVYQIYGVKHLEKVPYVNLHGVDGLLKAIGKDAGAARPESFVGNSWLQELEQKGFFQRFSR